MKITDFEIEGPDEVSVDLEDGSVEVWSMEDFKRRVVANENDDFRRFVPIDDIRGLQVTVTSEGVIFDLFELGDEAGTEAATFVEIADRLTTQLNERG